MKHDTETIILRMRDEKIATAVIAKVLQISEEDVIRIEKASITEEMQSIILDYWRDNMEPEAIAIKLSISVSKTKKEMKKLCLID